MARRGGRRREKYLDPNIDIYGEMLRLDSHRLGIIDRHNLMFRDIVLTACRNLHDIIMRHSASSTSSAFNLSG